jgi:predicted phage-related endonuclease
MGVEVFRPSTERAWLKLREKDLTSTEISALYGVNPYTTEFELYHRHSGGFQVEQSNEFTSWGQRLQWAVAKGISEDNGWNVKSLRNVYIRDSELRLGASYDYEIEIPGKGRGFLEIKNVFGMKLKDEWTKDEETGEYEAPARIELQVQQQLDLGSRSELGFEFGMIGALVGGNQVVLAERTLKPRVIDSMKKKAAIFWERIRTNNPPPPNFEVDHEFIAKLYGNAEEGSVLNLEGDVELIDLARQYREASEIEKQAETAKKAAKAKILMKVGQAEKVIGTGFSISASTVSETEVTYTRQAYRQFRVNWSRAKKESAA